MRRRLAALIILLVGLVSLLQAHDLFIKLDRYSIEPGATAVVPILNGTFAQSENAITWDRVADLSLVAPTGRARLDAGQWAARGDTTFVTIRAGAAGTYVLGASTHPRALELSAEDFNAYLEHDGIPDILEARTRDGELDRPARERYGKHVKAVFQVGATRSEGYAAVLGYPAEIVPLANPSHLRVGDTLRVRCLVDGLPARHQLAIAGGEASDGQPIAERSVRTDGNGVAMFPLTAAGRWYVKFIHMAPVEEEGLDYESKWATLTFEVR